MDAPVLHVPSRMGGKHVDLFGAPPESSGQGGHQEAL